MKRILIALLLSLLAGCAALGVPPVSKYDAITDQQVTALQQHNTMLFLDLQRKVGTDGFKYENFVPEYDRLEAEIQALRLRVQAVPDNSLTQQQVDLLERDFQLLQQAHKNGMSGAEIVPMRDAMDRIYGAILKLELAKKDMRAPAANSSK